VKGEGAYPQWSGFERAPEGGLLRQVVDVTGDLGIAYERCIGFYKDFHVHSRVMFVFPRGSCVMDIRTKRPAGNHRVHANNFLVVPTDLLHDDEGISSIYDTVALFPSDGFFSKVAAEEDTPSAEAHAFLRKCQLLSRTEWLEQLLTEYFVRRVLAQEPHSALTFFEHEIVRCVLRIAGISDLHNAAEAIESGGEVAELALQYIEANLFEEISIDDVAQHAHASMSTLLRQFRKKTGFTPKQYVRRRRLDEARALLARGRHRVGEVASLVGYSNFSAFSDAFRKRFEMPPSDVKAVGQGNPNDPNS